MLLLVALAVMRRVPSLMRQTGFLECGVRYFRRQQQFQESEAVQMVYKEEIEDAAREYVAYYAEDSTVMHRKFVDLDEVFVECHSSGDAERVAAELNHRYDFGIKVGYKQGELRGRTDAHLDTTAEIAAAVNAFLRNSKLSIMDSNFGGAVMAWHVYHDDAEGEYESTAATPLEAILDWYESEQEKAA